MDDVLVNMAFEDFGSQTSERAARRGEEMHDDRTIAFFFEGSFDGLDLPANPPDAVQELRFVADGVSHVE